MFSVLQDRYCKVYATRSVQQDLYCKICATWFILSFNLFRRNDALEAPSDTCKVRFISGVPICKAQAPTAKTITDPTEATSNACYTLCYSLCATLSVPHALLNSLCAILSIVLSMLQSSFSSSHASSPPLHLLYWILYASFCALRSSCYNSWYVHVKNLSLVCRRQEWRWEPIWGWNSQWRIQAMVLCSNLTA